MKKVAIIIVTFLALFFGYRYFFSTWEIRNSQPSGENIISFGDSLTYGTGANEGMDYPSQLSSMIGKLIINVGKPGDTTETALDRLDEDVLSQSPRIVLITLGGNDLKNGVSKEVAFRNLRKIVEAIQAEGALVVIGGVDFPLRSRGFGAAYEALARDTGCLLVPNVLKGLLGKSELMSDPIHPNGKGYAIMAKKFYGVIKPYL
jgi:lysophospholipase L1-like esterase